MLCKDGHCPSTLFRRKQKSLRSAYVQDQVGWQNPKAIAEHKGQVQLELYLPMNRKGGANGVFNYQHPLLFKLHKSQSHMEM